jgi:hypothetical protein
VDQRSFIGIGAVIAMTFAGTHTAASGEHPVLLAVVVYNQAAVPLEVLKKARGTISSIYREADVNVMWIDPASAAAGANFTIRLLIRPRAINAQRSLMGSALGDTHETGGSAFVYYDRVLRSAHERQQDVVGVLAYAMAHEMGHLLLPAPAHAPSGIMRGAWDGDDLRHIASGSLKFTPAQQAAIRMKALTTCRLHASSQNTETLPDP